MSKEAKDFVTAGTCKIVTDALTEKIAAQKLLVDAEIAAITGKIYSSAATLGIVISVLLLVLKFWRP
jgi:hypothetical protein